MILKNKFKVRCLQNLDQTANKEKEYMFKLADLANLCKARVREFERISG